MGMDIRSNYLCNSKIKNFFIALDKRNNLYTWNMLTGKLVMKNKIKQNFDGWEIY